MYLSYVGIRVTDLDKSLRFYMEIFGLRIVARWDNSKIGGGIYVLLKDPKSGQKLQLNFYPKSSPYNAPCTPGEGLDHIAFRVNSVADTLRDLTARDVQKADLIQSLQEAYSSRYDGSFHVAYVKDPDGLWIELYDHPEPIGTTIPEGY